MVAQVQYTPLDELRAATGRRQGLREMAKVENIAQKVQKNTTALG